jgi:methyltransferase (TIGR00027 family)
MVGDSQIKHVADTALWVAVYRAQESERPDAMFRDPLAGVLAGERGRKIAAAMPFGKFMEWILVIRTVAIDQLIANAIARGIDTVVNLGAGLDTRPYRMQLPSTLRWIEIDFPDMIAYKNEKLSGEKPVCHLERIAADLSDSALRRRIFDRIGSESKKALVITEGVIPYLSSAEAGALSEDLFAVTSFQYWIQDYYQGRRSRLGTRRITRLMKGAPFKFDGSHWLSFFQQHGWSIESNITAAEVAQRVRRAFPFVFPWSLMLYLIPKKAREQRQRALGYVMYCRGGL